MTKTNNENLNELKTKQIFPILWHILSSFNKALISFHQNLDYVIVSGARRQENRWDPKQNEQIVPEDKNVQKRLFDDAMFKLEHKTDDLDSSKKQNPRIAQMVLRNEDVWKDDFESNYELRKKYKVSPHETAAYYGLDRLEATKSH